MMFLFCAQMNSIFHIRESMNQIDYFNMNTQGFERVLYLYTILTIIANQIPFKALPSKNLLILLKNSFICLISFLFWIYIIQNMVFKNRDIQRT